MKNRETHEEDKNKSVEASRSARRAMGRARPDVSLPVPPPSAEMPADYGALLEDLKQRITAERLRVTLAANAAMVLLYWDIGRSILEMRMRTQRRDPYGY